MEILATLLLVWMFLMYAWFGTFRYSSRINLAVYWGLMCAAIAGISYFALRVEHYILPMTGLSWLAISWIREWPKTKRVFGLKP